MKTVVGIGLSAMLVGCSVTRPDQDNFTLQTGGAGIQPFLSALSAKLGRSAEAQDFSFPSSDPNETLRLRGSGATVIIVPMPDERCNPNAPMHATYKLGEYRIDLVYRMRSIAAREDAKQKLTEAAEQVGQRLYPFKEC